MELGMEYILDVLKSNYAIPNQGKYHSWKATLQPVMITYNTNGDIMIEQKKSN